MITKEELIMKVRRRLGYPMVKVEIDDTQVLDHIFYARQQYIKWAIGNAVEENYFTLMLEGNKSLYDLPSGTTEVFGFDSGGRYGGINTLFSLENYLFSSGAYNDYFASGFNLISYHLAMDFLETLKKYTPDKYNFRYHKYSNQLELMPTPSSGKLLVVDGVEYDSPGWVLVKSYVISGSTLNEDYDFEDYGEEVQQDLYSNPWILDYVTALSKITLGRIRQKFSSFSSLGNVGISLDGSDLISEGKEEKDKLEERLREEEAYTGYGISIG